MRRIWRWLASLWRGWRYQKIGGTWVLIVTRPLSLKRWQAARKETAVSLPIMNAVETLFSSVTDGRSHFAEMADRLGADTRPLWDDLRQRDHTLSPPRLRTGV